MRGTRGPRLVGARRGGSIPACAGNPAHHPARGPAWRVHPRVCGEPTRPTAPIARVAGPSPRVRGTPGLRAERRAGDRSIPACAGNPSRAGCRPGSTGVHPRVCGEPTAASSDLLSDVGPSPRVRGTPDAGQPDDRSTRSIPACAGNPILPILRMRWITVHPRVCGEPSMWHGEQRARTGPSPRVRGTRGVAAQRDAQPGSIPACAGNPVSMTVSDGSARVHPRVCGEPAHRLARPPRDDGPSPRVRGTPRRGLRPHAAVGSIPACAGNPAGGPRTGGHTKVHPRVCGEPRPDRRGEHMRCGPSPRVRGTPVHARPE